MNKVLKFFELYIFLTSFFLLSFDFKTTQFSLIQSYSVLNSFMSRITDGTNKFLVKQKKGRRSIDWFALKMKLASIIAQYVGMPCQSVYIIPSYEYFLGKKNQDLTAVLLTIVPGVSALKSKKYKNVYIKQRYKMDELSIYTGVNRKILLHMARHKDLAKIVALDTFIGYSDRHTRNFFYDKSTKRFWVIDMDSAFGRNFCRITCNNFYKMISNPRIMLRKKELRALGIFKNTLQKLVMWCHPEVVITKMIEIADEIGIQNKNASFRTITKNKLLQYAQKIKEMCQDAKKLIEITEQLIDIKSKVYA